MASSRFQRLGCDAPAMMSPRIGLGLPCNGVCLLPFEELAEQGFPIFRPIGTEDILAQELFKPLADIVRHCGVAVGVEPFLRGPETDPSRQRCIERHFLPLRMERRLLQLTDLAEERIDKA